MDEWSPLNVVYFIAGLIIVGLIFVWPGLLALHWRDRRREKTKALLRQRLHRKHRTNEHSQFPTKSHCRSLMDQGC
jgi:hypothetical protein